jgi:hypothetical protein
MSDPKPRTVLITTRPTRWVMVVDEDWDMLTEDERQEQIYECACDNDKFPPFRWEHPLPT